MRAFKMYVRPILEYACEVVNPYLARHVVTLERVQHDYMRRIALRAGIEYTDYHDRLCWRCHCLVNGEIMLAY